MADDFEPYPYIIHTNKELRLMLAGEKPLAVFAIDHTPSFGRTEALGGQDFATEVEAGRMVERSEWFSSEDAHNIEYLFFAVKGEEWRIEAYLLLLEMLYQVRTWSWRLEWMMGRLLGYYYEEAEYHHKRNYNSDGSMK